MIELDNDELKIICDALSAYWGRQHDAAGFFSDRLSGAGLRVLKDELGKIEDLYDRMWAIMQERGLE